MIELLGRDTRRPISDRSQAKRPPRTSPLPPPPPTEKALPAGRGLPPPFIADAEPEGSRERTGLPSLVRPAGPSLIDDAPPPDSPVPRVIAGGLGTTLIATAALANLTSSDPSLASPTDLVPLLLYFTGSLLVTAAIVAP